MAVKDKPITKQEMESALEPLKRDIERMDETLENMRHSIYGNDKIGMDEIVRDLKKKIDFMLKATYFVFTVVGGYIILEIVKFLVNGIAK